MENICVASGVNFNWYKSMGFWVSTMSLSSWKPSEPFRWIQEGLSIRYLGCQTTFCDHHGDLVYCTGIWKHRVAHFRLPYTNMLVVV